MEKALFSLSSRRARSILQCRHSSSKRHWCFAHGTHVEQYNPRCIGSSCSYVEGKNACWVPGTDHASIATEAKVVQKLRAEGIKKSDLSREEFLETCVRIGKTNTVELF
jgi:hypothetical protein